MKVGRVLLVFVAFAAGVGVGVFCGRGIPPRQDEASPIVDAASRRVSIRTDTSSSDAAGTPRQRVEPRQPEEQDPPATVEVVYADDSSEPPSEISAAHAMRRARRQAAREAREKDRQDFLSNLNADLLTAEQRSRHELYLAAVLARDAVRAEIVALSEKEEDRTDDGRRRLDDLRRRLAEAESVVRADAAAERRALREAAVRVYGLDEATVRALCEDLDSVDSAMER